MSSNNETLKKSDDKNYETLFKAYKKERTNALKFYKKSLNLQKNLDSNKKEKKLFIDKKNKYQKEKGKITKNIHNMLKIASFREYIVGKRTKTEPIVNPIILKRVCEWNLSNKNLIIFM